MLREIERIIEKAGPLTTRELAARMDIDESALEGMLQFLERKGKPLVRRQGGRGMPDTVCRGCSSTGCVGC